MRADGVGAGVAAYQSGRVDVGGVNARAGGCRRLRECASNGPGCRRAVSTANINRGRGGNAGVMGECAASGLTASMRALRRGGYAGAG